jgi:hypothetical protein
LEEEEEEEQQKQQEKEEVPTTLDIAILCSTFYDF